jgi:hypothetical protein
MRSIGAGMLTVVGCVVSMSKVYMRPAWGAPQHSVVCIGACVHDSDPMHIARGPCLALNKECSQSVTRACVPQASGGLLGEGTASCDPFVRVRVNQAVQRSKTLKSTLTPAWDETMIFYTGPVSNTQVSCLHVHRALVLARAPRPRACTCTAPSCLHVHRALVLARAPRCLLDGVISRPL